MNTKTADNNPTAPNTSVDELLSDTGLGKFIAQNKALVLAFVAIVILGVFGFGIYQSQKKEQNQSASDQIFTFKEKAILDVKAKDFSAEKLHDQAMQLLNSVGNYGGTVEVALLVSESLRQVNKLNLAQDVLELSLKHVSNAEGLYFIKNRLASIYEDLGETSKALETYKGIVASGTYFLEDQLYFNIGRLELMLGDKDKARKSFEYVVNKGEKAEGEFLKLSELYLKHKLN